MSQGKLIVISGASGVGKGTVLKLMMEQRSDLFFSVSATTRPPRPDEVDGKHYFFVTTERFRDMIHRDAFLEYDRHNDYYYGTPRDQIAEKRQKGHVPPDDAPQGAKMVRSAAGQAGRVRGRPPSVEELERRLRGRGDTPEDQIAMRLDRAKWEMEQRSWYDYVVVNDDAQRCAQEILNIIG